MTDLSDLAVRCARAELERDKALERATNAERALTAMCSNDPEQILDVLHIIGIPARDLKDIYAAYQWHLEQQEKAA